MRKINAQHNSCDRVVCVKAPDKLRFYYQPARSGERIWLFDTHKFSGSVFAYFREHGRSVHGEDRSITLRELYRFKDYGSFKLAKVMQRIPGQVEYVIRELEAFEKDRKRHAASVAQCRDLVGEGADRAA